MVEINQTTADVTIIGDFGTRVSAIASLPDGSLYAIQTILDPSGAAIDVVQNLLMVDPTDGTILSSQSLGLSGITGLAFDQDIGQLIGVDQVRDELVFIDVATQSVVRRLGFDSAMQIAGIAVITASVPEPSTLALLGAGLLGFAWRRQA